MKLDEFEKRLKAIGAVIWILFTAAYYLSLNDRRLEYFFGTHPWIISGLSLSGIILGICFMNTKEPCFPGLSDSKDNKFFGVIILFGVVLIILSKARM